MRWYRGLRSGLPWVNPITGESFGEVVEARRRIRIPAVYDGVVGEHDAGQPGGSTYTVSTGARPISERVRCTAGEFGKSFLPRTKKGVVGLAVSESYELGDVEPRLMSWLVVLSSFPMRTSCPISTFWVLESRSGPKADGTKLVDERTRRLSPSSGDLVPMAFLAQGGESLTCRI